MESEPMLTPVFSFGKILPRGGHGAASSRTVSPTHFQQTILAPSTQGWWGELTHTHWASFVTPILFTLCHMLLVYIVSLCCCVWMVVQKRQIQCDLWTFEILDKHLVLPSQCEAVQSSFASLVFSFQSFAYIQANLVVKTQFWLFKHEKFICITFFFCAFQLFAFRQM